MGQFKVGQVVVVKFPFSNLSAAKNRPALVVAIGDYGNPVLCQITSVSPDGLEWVVPMVEDDILGGGLHIASYIRVDKMFTADPVIIVSIVGELSRIKLLDVKQKLVVFFGL